MILVSHQMVIKDHIKEDKVINPNRRIKSKYNKKKYHNIKNKSNIYKE